MKIVMKIQLWDGVNPPLHSQPISDFVFHILKEKKTIRVEIGWPSLLPFFVRWSFSKGLVSCKDYASGPVLSIMWVVICPVQTVQP